MNEEKSLVTQSNDAPTARPVILLSVAMRNAKRAASKLEMGISRGAAFRLAGLDPEEMDRAIEVYPTVRHVIERAEAICEEGLVALIQHAAQTDGKLALEMLGRRSAAWAASGNKSTVHHEHQIGLAKGAQGMLAEMQRERAKLDEELGRMKKAAGKVIDVQVDSQPASNA